MVHLMSERKEKSWLWNKDVCFSKDVPICISYILSEKNLLEVADHFNQYFKPKLKTSTIGVFFGILEKLAGNACVSFFHWGKIFPLYSRLSPFAPQFLRKFEVFRLFRAELQKSRSLTVSQNKVSRKEIFGCKWLPISSMGSAKWQTKLYCSHKPLSAS